MARTDGFPPKDLLAHLERGTVRVDDHAREIALGDVWPLGDEAGDELHELAADWVEGGCVYLDEDFALGGFRNGNAVEAEDL